MSFILGVAVGVVGLIILAVIVWFIFISTHPFL